jgi:hypothetical protein
MNPNLRDLARETKNDNIKLDDKVKLPGEYEYVASIGLYVPKNPNLSAFTSFYHAQDLAQQQGGRMMTLPEWWEYYSHCMRQERLLGLETSKEFVDTTAYKKSITLRPGSDDEQVFEKSVVLGSFDLKDIDPQSGWPKKAQSGPFVLMSAPIDKILAVIMNCTGQSVILEAVREANVTQLDEEIKLRVCYEPES